MRELISEADPQFEQLATPEVRQAVQLAHDAAMKTPEELQKEGKTVGLSPEVKAKYKIEVMFGPKRKSGGPNIVKWQVFESGKRMHGGGDDLAFWCRSSETGEGCWNIIPSDCIKNGVGICPHCRRAVNASQLADTARGNYTTKNLATELELLFHKLNDSADIYLKYSEDDVRFLAMRRAKGEIIARRLKGMHIYPLKNILRDTMHGASLQKRFAVFLDS